MSESKHPGEGMPRHIALIMDGNGRWARQRGMPREYGHRFGVKAFQTILEHCEKLEIEAVTVYAFSTENWKRPQKEVDAIMKLMDHYLADCEKNIDQYNMRICFLGDKTPFEEKRRARMERLEAMTAERQRVLNIALNYGGRDELVHAFNVLREHGIDNINSDDINNALYTAGCPDPDLIVRTAGEYRLSNFLLWQSTYSEFYFTDVLWPDFNKEELINAIVKYNGRERRYGGIK